MLFTILLYLSALSYCLLFIAYRYGWSSTPTTGAPAPSPDHPFLSIVIPARNEAHHISDTLHSIISNDYPSGRYEIILIDDYSDDDTGLIARELFRSHPGINGKVIFMKDILGDDPTLNAYKKKALETAILTARGDYIVTTDADCIVPPGWLRHFAGVYTDPDVHFIMAPVSFIPAHRKDLCYYFQSVDFMTMQGITAASHTLRWGKMCNGANLSFSREAFSAVGGYAGIDHLASGDDMMLMHKIAQQYPRALSYLRHQGSIVHTPAQPGWKSFLNQRIRWASKNGKYKDIPLTVNLLIVYLFNLLLFTGSVLACFRPSLWIHCLIILVIKILSEQLLIVPVSRFYNKQKELPYHVLLQPLHILYIITAGFLGMAGKYEWKGRVVR